MDRLGSNIRQTNPSEGVTSNVRWDAFGNVISATGTQTGPFGFAGAWGYQQDTDSGLQLLGHRYYDPSTGRFLTRDPIKDGRNWYGYCENNPLKYVDPGGHRAITIGLGGQVILFDRSFSLSLSIAIGDGGMAVGTGVGKGRGAGLYAGFGLIGGYDETLILNDPRMLKTKGHASGVATQWISAELSDDDGDLGNGGINGGGLGVGPAVGGGIYHEERGGGWLPLW